MPEPALLKFLSLRIDSFVHGDRDGWTGCAGKHTCPLSFKYSISYPWRFVKGFLEKQTKYFLYFFNVKKKNPSPGGVWRGALFGALLVFPSRQASDRFVSVYVFSPRGHGSFPVVRKEVTMKITSVIGSTTNPIP